MAYTFNPISGVLDYYEKSTALSGVITDHSNLTGLDADGHPQYHNDTRGDARYYTKVLLSSGQLDTRYYTEPEVNTISGSLQTGIDGKSDTGHTHTESDITDLDKYTQAQVDALTWTESDITDLDKYTQAQVNTISGVLQTGIDGKSDTGHTHTESDITDLDKYTRAEVNTISGSLNDKISIETLWSKNGTILSTSTIGDTISGSGPVHSTSEFGDGTNYSLKWEDSTSSINVNFTGGPVTHKLLSNGDLEITGELIESGLTTSGTDEQTATIQTTTSGINTCGYITLDNNSIYNIEATVLARETNGTNRASFHIEGCFYNEGGNTTQEGNTVSIATIKSNNDWECIFNINSDKVEIQVNSNTVATINWFTTLEYTLLS